MEDKEKTKPKRKRNSSGFSSPSQWHHTYPSRSSRSNRLSTISRTSGRDSHVMCEVTPVLVAAVVLGAAALDHPIVAGRGLSGFHFPLAFASFWCSRVTSRITR